MKDFELVKSRLDCREKGTPMSLEEARNLFDGTTIFIYQAKNGKYGWMAIMSEDEGYNTPRSAVNSALSYLERDGY